MTNKAAVEIKYGAFLAEGNVASCSETGVPLLDAMASADPAAALTQVIDSCQRISLTLQDIARARLIGMKYSAQDGSLETVTREALELAPVFDPETSDSKSAFALNARLRRSE